MVKKAWISYENQRKLFRTIKNYEKIRFENWHFVIFCYVIRVGKIFHCAYVAFSDKNVTLEGIQSDAFEFHAIINEAWNIQKTSNIPQR